MSALRAEGVAAEVGAAAAADFEYVSCQLCGADDTRLLFRAQDTLGESAETFNVVQCRRCGLAYLNPRPAPAALPRYYTEDYFQSFASGGLSRPGLRRWVKRIYNRLTGRLASAVESRAPGRVLDVGCGDGRYLDLFRARGWVTYGVDPSAVAVARARQRGLEVFHGQLSAAGLPAGSFDLVLLRYTIENMHNPLEVLSEVRRVLRDDGQVFLAAPTIDCPAVRWFKGYCAYVDAPRHLYFFTLETLTRMLERAGLRVERLARVPAAHLRDVLDRGSRGCWKRWLRHPWISRAIFLAEMPLILALAAAGVNRGTLEVIARKQEAAGESPRIGAAWAGGAGGPAEGDRVDPQRLYAARRQPRSSE